MSSATVSDVTLHRPVGGNVRLVEAKRDELQHDPQASGFKGFSKFRSKNFEK